MIFRRGIRNESFLKALEALAQQDSWWRDVLADNSLIIGIRDEYLNVYWQGQSIFRVSFKAGTVTASTHQKYLLNPGIKGQISLIGGSFDLSKAAETMLTRDYEGVTTLERLKKAAALYSGREKEGVHEIAISNPTIVDVEIAINAAAVSDVLRKLPRMDVASFEKADTGVDLVFWEAKTFSNPELETGEVVKQVKEYRAVIAAHHADIAESYSCVAKNLLDMGKWSNGSRPIAQTTRDVAAGAKINVTGTTIGLLVYDFTADQRDREDKDGNTLRKKLEKLFEQNELGIDRFRFKGTAKGLAL
ncbi:hypothetical protein [Bradyrhizobium diazoefficiens]|nr:hypothetical protein [Bradyrhizobium diazoefficiens]BCF40406.1 hypothetical protein XF16B_08960 [Bradyrhizobium diazoefficiens]BCF66544.1 hypothetical protein XF19B_08970 [Bradyrhizobium diazoefficiens]